MRKLLVLLAGAMLVGCGGSGSDLLELSAGDCFNSSAPLTLFGTVETAECTEPHRHQVIGVVNLLGDRVSTERTRQAESACTSALYQVRAGRALPAGADLEVVFDRRASGNIRSEAVCVITHRQARTGGLLR